jgi:hypothetical protein
MEDPDMKCPKCQFENRETVKFCEKCGEKLELICPGCSARIPPDRLFCGECGRDLRTPRETPRVDGSVPQSYTPKHLAEKILTSKIALEGERWGRRIDGRIAGQDLQFDGDIVRFSISPGYIETPPLPLPPYVVSTVWPTLTSKGRRARRRGGISRNP